MFAEIGLLVLEGDAAGLAAKVSELSTARMEALAGDEGEHGREQAAQEGESGSNCGQPPGGLRDAPAPLVHSPNS